MHLVEEALQIVGALGDDARQRPGRNRCAEPVGKQLGGALVGQVLAGDQIDGKGPDARPVLCRGQHASGKACGGQLPAAAAATLGGMLDDP